MSSFLPADRRDEMLEWLEDPERDAPPVSFESGRCITLNKNGAVLRIGDKSMTDVGDGEVRIEIEHSPVTIMVPSAPAKTTKTVKSEVEQ